MPRRPLIVAHRGLHADLPENSRAAMSAAWSGGVPWAECDVRQGRDGLYLLHDASLDRTTDGAGPIDVATDAQLGRARLRDAAGRVTDHPLPRLSDVTAVMPPDGRLLVEVKSVRDVDRLVADLAGRAVWVQSFDPDDLRRTHHIDPSLPLAQLVETAEHLAMSMDLPYAAVHLDHVMLDEAVCRQLRARSKSIGVWTVNVEADVRRVVALGVETIITDEPATVRRVVDELFGPG